MIKLLRDIREGTKFLILYEMVTDKNIKLKALAKKLGITIQGISEYLKIMQFENLVFHDGYWKATKKGVQFLHENFTILKKFVDNGMKKLSIIERCVAIAKEDIKRGEKVSLYMEEGFLTAYRYNKKSASSGIAVYNAKKNSPLAVSGLEGIIEIPTAKIYFIELPSYLDANPKVSLKKIRDICKNLKYCKCGILDTPSHSIGRKIFSRIDFEYNSLNSAIEACQKGISVVLLGSSENVSECIAKIESINTSTENKIVYELHRASTPSRPRKR